MTKTPDRFELRDRYANMTNEELLTLAGEPDSVTEEARYALHLELRERSLGDSDIQPFAKEKAAKASGRSSPVPLHSRLQWIWPNIVDEVTARRAARTGASTLLCINLLADLTEKFGTPTDDPKKHGHSPWKREKFQIELQQNKREVACRSVSQF
jgi:hypothetical protein